MVKVSYSNTPVNDFENSSAGTRVKEFGVEITAPVPVNPNDMVMTGLIYERTELKLFESNDEDTISIAGLKLGLIKKHSEKWSGSYVLLPKLSSDFNGPLSIKDFQIGGIALMKFTKNENLNYKFGLYYNSELFGPFLVPLFGLYYLSDNKKFESTLTLPFLADANYKLLDKLKVGVNFSAQVRSYHLNEISAGTNGYAVKDIKEIGSYLRFTIVKGLSIQARVAYSLGRSYRVFEEGDKIKFGSILIKVDDHRERLNTDFSNGLIYQTSLIYRIGG